MHTSDIVFMYNYLVHVSATLVTILREVVRRINNYKVML